MRDSGRLLGYRREMIQGELNEALKAGEKVKVSVLRMLISEMKNKKIADRVKELDDEGVIAVVHKMVKQHKESIEQFKQGGRDDLVASETAELAVLEEYMPEQLSEEEIIEIVESVIQKTGASSPQDMGKVMGAVIGQVIPSEASCH